MKNIKDQISAIVVFKANNLKNLAEEYGAIYDRLYDGVAKMKASNLYNISEIDEIRAYVREILTQRYNSAKADITAQLRSQFNF